MLKCVAVVEGKRVELKQQPLFLGYKPLVMGVCDAPELVRSMMSAKTVTLEYLNKTSGEQVAELRLHADKTVPVEDQLLLLLTGISGTHKLESFWDRIGFRLNEMLSRKSPANIDLTSAEYDQLKIGYSIPREIRLLRVATGDDANEFPIDLFGFIGDSHFVLSLRHAKKSAEQVASAEHVEVRPVAYTHVKAIYNLGRFHSAEMGARAASPERSGSTALHRLEVIGDHGIHRLFLFRAGKSVSSPHPSDHQLVHVHTAYAKWHKEQGFPLKEAGR